MVANTLTYADLTSAQKGFVENFKEWFELGSPSFATLKGFAGSGKSACLKIALQELGYEAAKTEFWASAPTHAATGILENFLGDSVAGASTLQSLLGLRPRIAKFTQRDERRLQLLQAVEHHSEAEELELELLLKKQQLALEQAMSFEPTKPKPLLPTLRLLIVDECGMVNQQLFALLYELISEGELVSPSLQVLFVGDPAQLPPVGEAESLTFSRTLVLAELTDVVRYSGTLLEYASAVRTSTGSPELIHRGMAEDDQLFRIPPNMAVREGAEIIGGGDETVRFICGTNQRCRELNVQIRTLLKKNVDLAYEPSDELITTSAVQRGEQGLWVSEPALFERFGWTKTGRYSGKSSSFQMVPAHVTGRTRKGLPVLGTSTYLKLVEDISDRPNIEVIDAYLSNLHGAVVCNHMKLTPECFTHKTLTGRTFERSLWTYILSDGGSAPGDYVWLLDPNQVDAHLAELKTLKQLAQTTKSRARGKRGQEGQYAKQAWELLGLKNWETWADGRPVLDDEYRDIQRFLWAEFHSLDCFCDPVSWSYAITCHRSQGQTIDIAVIDIPSIVGPSRKGNPNSDGLWDVRKSLYTAATRARAQVALID